MNHEVQIHRPELLVTASEAATTHMKNMMRSDEQAIGVRFGVKKTGCSGFSYVFELIHQVAENDLSIQLAPGLLVAVSREHLPLLQGTALDYVKKGLNSQWEIRNPNEKGACGCGESFTV